jgi:hypothetical protein
VTCEGILNCPFISYSFQNQYCTNFGCKVNNPLAKQPSINPKKGRFFLRIPNLSQDCHREKSLSAAVDLNLKGNPSRLGI